MVPASPQVRPIYEQGQEPAYEKVDPVLNPNRYEQIINKFLTKLNRQIAQLERAGHLDLSYLYGGILPEYRDDQAIREEKDLLARLAYG